MANQIGRQWLVRLPGTQEIQCSISGRRANKGNGNCMFINILVYNQMILLLNHSLTVCKAISLFIKIFKGKEICVRTDTAASIV